MIVFLLAACLSLVQAETPRKGDLPLQVPQGWDSKRQEAARVLVVKDLPPGKLYTVVIPDLVQKVGSLKGLMDVAKALLGETGTFKPARDPSPGKNEGGWEYEIVIGTLEKDGAGMLAQAVVLRKGEEEGLILTFSDSLATMEKQSDAFSAMIKGIGAPKPAPAAVAPGTVDLKYTTPPGWTTKILEGGVLHEGMKDEGSYKVVYRLLILPSQPLVGTLRKTFLDYWASQIKPTLETTIVPLPLVRRLKSGMAVAFDQDPSAKNKDGAALWGGLYLLARGGRCVPILGLYYNMGNTDELEKALLLIFESAEIPGAGPEKVALIDPADLLGDWSTSSVSLANYVTSSGAYAGDASIYTGAGLHLNKDETYKQTLMAITKERRLKESSEGKWKVEDNELMLLGKDAEGRGRRYRIFGVGGDDKGGWFLVLSSNNDSDQQADLPKPRRVFGGEWFKRK